MGRESSRLSKVMPRSADAGQQIAASNTMRLKNISMLLSHSRFSKLQRFQVSAMMLGSKDSFMKVVLAT